MRVLIPIDGSETSRWVLWRGRRLLETHSVVPFLFTVVPGAPESVRLSVGYEMLRETRATLRNAGVWAMARVAAGDPVTEILREIRRGAYDLVALATHGRRGLDRLLFGSVAARLIESSPVPLLLFPPGPQDVVEFRRIRLARGAEELLPLVRAFQENFGSQVVDDNPDVVVTVLEEGLPEVSSVPTLVCRSRRTRAFLPPASPPVESVEIL